MVDIVNITISGLTNTGKTTIAVLLGQVFKEYGIENVSISGEGEDELHNANLTFDKNMESLKRKNTQFVIKTIRENKFSMDK